MIIDEIRERNLALSIPTIIHNVSHVTLVFQGLLFIINITFHILTFILLDGNADGTSSFYCKLY